MKAHKSSGSLILLYFLYDLDIRQSFLSDPCSQHNVLASPKQPTLLDVYCLISFDK